VAGVTGPDGPSHHGMWNLALLGVVPGIRIAAPRDADTLVEGFEEALAVQGPTALRFPKASLGDPVPALRRSGRIDLLHEPPVGADDDVLVVSVGVMAAPAVAAAERLADEGIGCTVVDPRWVLPVDDDLLEMAARHRCVVTVEDGVREGGIGSRIALALGSRGVDVPVRCLGLPSDYLGHGSRAALLEELGLDDRGIADSCRAAHQAVSPDARAFRLVQGASARSVSGSTG